MIGMKKWAYFYVMEAKNGHFSVFSSSWKIDWSKFFPTYSKIVDFYSLFQT